MDDSIRGTGATPGQPQIPTAQRPGSPSSEALALARVLTARLCHDISGLAGTLTGAVDMLPVPPGPDGNFSSEARVLAGEAARALRTRLRLLRAAWAGEAAPLSLETLRELGTGLGARIRLDLAAPAEESVLPAAFGRVVLNALLLAAQALPKGGEVALIATGPGQWMVMPRGPQAAWPAGFAALLASADRAWAEALAANSRSLQAPLLILLATEAGIRLSPAMAGHTEGAAPLILTLP